MGWGMQQALGEALQRAGSTFGTERLDLRRQLDLDEQRKAAHELALRQGNKNIESIDHRMKLDTNADTRAQSDQDWEVSQRPVVADTNRAALEAKQLEVRRLREELNANPPEQRAREIQLRLNALEANIRQSNVSTDATLNADRRAATESDLRVQAYQRGNRPEVLAEADLAPQIAEFRTRAGALFNQTLAPPRMVEVDNQLVPAGDASPQQAEAFKTLQSYAGILARGLVDRIDNERLNQKLPALTPAERAALEQQKLREFTASLMAPVAPPAAAAPGGAGGPKPPGILAQLAAEEAAKRGAMPTTNASGGSR